MTRGEKASNCRVKFIDVLRHKRKRHWRRRPKVAASTRSCRQPNRRNDRLRKGGTPNGVTLRSVDCTILVAACAFLQSRVRGIACFARNRTAIRGFASKYLGGYPCSTYLVLLYD